MANIQHISSQTDIPSGENYVLVTYGAKSLKMFA